MRRALLASALVVAARGASDSLPHFHRGKFSPYEIGPPSVSLSSSDEQRLAAGEPITQAYVNSDGHSRRLLMVKDICAPADVVMGRILDFDRYKDMVKGCDECERYEMSESNGLKTIKCSYKIHAASMRFHYFMEHTLDPRQHCLTWHLDYRRRSDLDDSVGYWYIQPRGQESCRAFYSCDTKLRTWVPGPVYAIMTKQALKQATVWVDYESVKEWERRKSARRATGLEAVASEWRTKWQQASANIRRRGHEAKVKLREPFFPPKRQLTETPPPASPPAAPEADPAESSPQPPPLMEDAEETPAKGMPHEDEEAPAKDMPHEESSEEPDEEPSPQAPSPSSRLPSHRRSSKPAFRPPMEAILAARKHYKLAFGARGRARDRLQRTRRITTTTDQIRPSRPAPFLPVSMRGSFDRIQSSVLMVAHRLKPQ